MVIDFRKNVNMHEFTSIKGETVECVQSYKHLGTIIESKLSFEANCEMVCKKGASAPVLFKVTVSILN